MAIPIQVQLFDAFLGTQESIHSVILPDIFSSGGSQNVYIDKFARVAQVPGYTRQNTAAPMTTNGVGSAVMIRGLIPYRATIGGVIARKLLVVIDDQVDEWEVFVSTDNGVTAAFVYDGGVASVGSIPDAAQFGDKLYLTNGKVQPRLYNGTSFTSTGLTQSPSLTVAASASAGVLTGNYRYKLVSTFADATRKAGSSTSTTLLVTAKQASLSWTADADTTVVGYEIYRTTGTGTTFYHLTSITGRTTVAHTDNTPDTTLLEKRVLEEHGDPPPVAYFCEPHKQRMWWLRTDALPTRGYWSDPGEAESVYAQSYLEFSDSETVGDVITGAVGSFEGLLVVFTEKALWTVSGTGAVIGDIVDWTKSRTNSQTGCVSGRSAARIPAGSKYSDQTGQTQTTQGSTIAYFTPLGDIRIFNGDTDIIVSHPARETLRTFNYAQRAKIHAVVDSDNDQVIWFVPTVSSLEPNKAICWNYRYGVWYVWPTMPFASSVSMDTIDDAALLLVGEALVSKGGFIYTLLNGTSFDGSAIDAIWMTKTLYGTNEEGSPATAHRKRWRWLDLLFRVTRDISITVEWLTGSTPDLGGGVASTVVAPGTGTLVTASGTTILTAPGSTMLSMRQSAQARALLHDTTGDYLHDEGLRLRVKTNGTTGGWALEALQLAYQILPGLKRRNQ